MDKYYYGRRPTQPMIPNFRNIQKQEMDFQRGYMVFFGADRSRGNFMGEPELGASLKENLSEAGGWFVSSQMQGETIPKEKNHAEKYLQGHLLVTTENGVTEKEALSF